jgi:6-phosphogluconolactonase
MNTARKLTAAALALGAGVLLSSCADQIAPTAPSVDASFQRSENTSSTAAGAVYLMSNANGANQVLVYRRSPDGSLTAEAPVATGGQGTGSGLGNQAAVVLSEDGRWLLVVNPGSDDVSVFRVRPSGLELTDVQGSGGDMPVSVAIHGSLVYVLNAGSPNNVSGFRLGNDGSLSPLAGSSRPLSAASTGPAQVGFNPRGDVLVVTEKGTNMITTYLVGADGLLSAPDPQASAGQTPFGFGFDHRGLLIVSEATSGSVSSYRVGRDGGLSAIDPVVSTTETAACWIAVSRNGRFAYSTNGGSGSVTGFRIGHDGSLHLLDEDGRTGVTGPGSTPLDAAFSVGGRYLYVLSSGLHEVSVFRFGSDGSLTPMPGASGLPATANGMAAR